MVALTTKDPDKDGGPHRKGDLRGKRGPNLRGGALQWRGLVLGIAPAARRKPRQPGGNR